MCIPIDAVWAFVRQLDHGGLAIHAAHIGTAFNFTKVGRQPGEVARSIARSLLGEHEIVFRAVSGTLEQLQIPVSLTTAVPLLVLFTPRDLYPLGENDDVMGATRLRRR